MVVTVDGGVCGEPVVADDGFAVVRGVVVAVVVAVVVGPEGVAVADGGAGVVVAEEDTGVVDVVVVGSGEVDVFSVIGESGEPAAPVGVA